MRFQDRRDAGRRLAERLAREDFVDPVVLALPRGGVPVAAPVAEALGAPLHVFVARKIGAPGHPEFGIGAIAEGRDEVVVSVAAARLGLSEEDLERLAADARAELDRQVTAYRGGAELPPLQSRDVVVIDDGLATGVTAEAALRSLRRNRPRRLTFAAPICAADTAHRLKGLADEVICVSSPRQFYAVGQGYEDFEPTTDEEVLRILRRGTPAPRAATAVEERAVVLDLKGGGQLHADLTLPEQSDGVVLFAHGSGSSRHSPRNRFVAAQLQQHGLATLLADLLTDEEERVDIETQQFRFDVELLAERLAALSAWLARDPATADRALGYFGASTGAAAALIAAAEPGNDVRAVVSRGGRPDLAEDALRRVSAPTLLIVGSRDVQVLELNRQALDEVGGPARLEIVEDASHLFEEPGALDRVAALAGEWFTTHLSGR